MINLTNDVQSLYTENYKTLIIKDVKEDLKKLDIPHALIGRLNIFKRLIFPKLLHRFKEIPINIIAGIF